MRFKFVLIGFEPDSPAIIGSESEFNCSKGVQQQNKIVTLLKSNFIAFWFGARNERAYSLDEFFYHLTRQKDGGKLYEKTSVGFDFDF